MKKDLHVTKEEALAAIGQIDDARSRAEDVARQPVWLIVAGTLVFSVLTGLFCIQSVGGLTKAAVPWLAAVIVAIQVLWFYKCKKDGVILRIMPIGRVNKLFYWLQVIGFNIVLFGGKALYESGVYWIPTLAALVGGAAYYFFVYKYPTTEIRNEATSH